MTVRLVKVDSGPHAATRYGRGWAVVGIDVFRATTVICTASAMGRRCLVAANVREAFALAANLPRALVGGEQGGRLPPRFDVGNSPTEVAERMDLDRPLVLVTSSGTPLLRQATSADVIYAACLRNVCAQVACLLTEDRNVAVIGAGTGGEHRREDDLGCARVAAGLLAGGFAADPTTRALVDQIGGLPTEWAGSGRSAAFLRRVGRQDDINFVLSHVDDIEAVFQVAGTEVLRRHWSGVRAN